MIPLSRPIYVAAQPVDLRRSFDALAEHARAQLGLDAQQGALVLFFNRDRDRCKLLFHDRSGWALLYKRLDRGRFPVPQGADPNSPSVRIDARELALVLEGLTFTKTRADASARTTG